MVNSQAVDMTTPFDAPEPMPEYKIVEIKVMLKMRVKYEKTNNDLETLVKDKMLNEIFKDAVENIEVV